MANYNDDGRGKLYGSWTAHNFRFAHKSLNPKHYATDIDFMLIADNDVIAALELKCKNTEVDISEKQGSNLYQYSQSIAFMRFIKFGIPCFVVLFQTNTNKDVWDIDIKKVVDIDVRNRKWITQDIVSGINLEQFDIWEQELRDTIKVHNSLNLVYSYIQVNVKIQITDDQIDNDSRYHKSLDILSDNGNDSYRIVFIFQDGTFRYGDKGRALINHDVLKQLNNLLGEDNVNAWHRIITP